MLSVSTTASLFAITGKFTKHKTWVYGGTQKQSNVGLRREREKTWSPGQSSELMN